MYPYSNTAKNRTGFSIDSTSIIRIRTRVAIFSRGAKTFFPPFFLSNQLCISNNDYIWLNLWNNYCNNFPSFISIRYLRPGEYFSQRGWLRLIKRDFHSRTSFSINLFLVWRRYKAENSFSIGKRKKRISIEREEKLRDRRGRGKKDGTGFETAFLTTASIGSQVISAPMQKGESITDTVASDTDGWRHIQFIHREIERRSVWPAASLARWMASSFLVQPGWLRPRLPFAILISNESSIHIARQSPFIPFLPKPSFFLSFFSFTSTLFLWYARFSFFDSWRYSPISPSRRWIDGIIYF